MSLCLHASSTNTGGTAVGAEVDILPAGYKRFVVDLWGDQHDDGVGDDGITVSSKKVASTTTTTVSTQYILVRFPEHDNFHSVGFEEDNCRVLREHLIEFRRLQETRPVMVVYQSPYNPTAASTSTVDNCKGSSGGSSSIGEGGTDNVNTTTERALPQAIYRGRWHTKTTPLTNQTDLVVCQTFNGNHSSSPPPRHPSADSRPLPTAGAKRSREEEIQGEETIEDILGAHRTISAGYPISAILTMDRINL